MASTYHLWLTPTGQTYDILMKTITDLSNAHHAPVFDPHVTLLGSLPGTEEAISLQCVKLGGLLAPFNIFLAEPAYGDQYFQCVFFKTQETPALMNAHELAKNLFGKAPNPFMPHLSLLYGHYSLKLKHKITSNLSQVLPLNFTVDTIHLIHSKSEHPMDWASILSVPLSG